MQLWDLNKIWNNKADEKMKPQWIAKNLPNDHLDLTIPIWDTDLTFLADISPYSLAACTAYGDVREYDTRQRKPVIANELFNDNEGKDIFQQK